VPSGEELGAEFERFLAGMSGDSDSEGSDGDAGTDPSTGTGDPTDGDRDA